MNKVALYAIHLRIVPAVQLAPPSRFPEAGKRQLHETFATVEEAVDCYERARRYGNWPAAAEPEVRDLVEGHVVSFKTHKGEWKIPIPLNSVA